MESKDKLKEIDIKSRTCYYCGDIITDRDINFDNILLDKKLYKKEYENILIYENSYKTSTSAKPLRIDGFIKTHN